VKRGPVFPLKLRSIVPEFAEVESGSIGMKKLSPQERDARRERLRGRIVRSRFLVPNAVTVGNMFCGFLSIVHSSSGRFKEAALAVLFAILLDGLDGRVARRLNATSPFGVEFDSFSDLVSFGLAPGLLVYNWCFKMQADEVGVLVAFLYAVCAAGRLARFNVAPPTLRAFVGLPSPGAAAAMASMVYAIPEPVMSSFAVGLVALITLVLGVLMVASIPYTSIKMLKLSHLHLPEVVAIAAFIALLWYSARIGLLVVSFGYASSGVVLWTVGRQQRERSDGGESTSCVCPPEEIEK
jgi:CDP-diacylglycerol--serine O-phosphatidyltransferase